MKASCDHEHCDTGDMLLICHLTYREHMFKGLCAMSHSLAKFGGHWSEQAEI